jgi:anti-anti-sigma regulatory factor
MENRWSGPLIVDNPSAVVYVARFVRPDLRKQLCDDPDILGCELFRELEAQVLNRLAAGDTLVLNLGLVEPFPTALYRFLLKVREVVNQRSGRLVLCRLSAEARDVFELFKAFRLFQVTASEVQALRAANAREHQLVH